MRRRLFGLAALGVSLALILPAWAGEDAEAIVAKALKAHLPKGPEKKQGMQGKNKGTLYVQGLELEFTQQTWIQYPPGKFKEVMDLTVMNNAIKTTTVYNGKDAWIKVNDMDIPLPDGVLDEFKETVHMMGLGMFAGFKDKGIKVELIGEAQVNGKPAVGVRFTKEGKKDISLYFDKTSGLMAKTERRARDFQTGQEVTEERIITEYQEIDGRKVAKKVLVNRDGKKLMEAEVLETRNFDKLDDAEFAKP